MGIIVNVKTGEFVATGDLGNLADTLMVLSEMGSADHLRIYPEDEAYAEF